MPLDIILKIILILPWTEIIMLIIQMIQDREVSKNIRTASNPPWTGDACRELNISLLKQQYPDMPEARLRWMHDLTYDFLQSCKGVAKDWKQVLDEYLSNFGFDHQIIYKEDFNFMDLYTGKYGK